MSVLRLSLLFAGVALFVGVSGCSNSSASKSDGSTGGGYSSGRKKAIELLNVSNDPTRELWKEMSAAFSAEYEKSNNVSVTIKPSHGGSATQARAVIDGLEADIVTLGLYPDTEAIHERGLIADGWESRLPNNSVPYTSTIVFLVRKGNPKGIKDWPDLIKEKVEIITPSPKTSGNGRLSFLAAWGSVLENGGSAEDASRFVKSMYRNVSTMDAGARGATTTFVQKKLGDVLLTFESEAYLAVKEAKGGLEVVYPSVSILVEPPVAVVDAYVEKHKTRDAAEAFLKFLYTPQGQEILARHHYRPVDPEIARKTASQFPELKLFKIDRVARNWIEAQETYFSDGGVFDRIYGSAG
jgi:sulfate transport system substrate-binding protein